MRLKEHRDAYERGMMEKSAVAEHVWENHHPIDWKETTCSAGPWERTGAVGERVMLPSPCPNLFISPFPISHFTFPVSNFI